VYPAEKEETHEHQTRTPRRIATQRQTTTDLIGENGLIRQLTKALLERALEAE
jgi:hypothetical protein